MAISVEQLKQNKEIWKQKDAIVVQISQDLKSVAKDLANAGRLDEAMVYMEKSCHAICKGSNAASMFLKVGISSVTMEQAENGWNQFVEEYSN